MSLNVILEILQDILEERQKPSHKGYFKIVKEIMLTHTDEVI